MSTEGAHIEGRRFTERRVQSGQVWSVDGLELRVFGLGHGEAIPEPALPDEGGDDLELDWPDDVAGQEAHAVLIHRHGANESRIHFHGDTLALGADADAPVVAAGDDFLYLLRREPDGSYTLEDATGPGMSELPPILPLQHGDTFAVADRSFTFEQANVTEVTPIAGLTPSKSKLVPILIHLDAGRATLPILDDVFSVGRGQGNDLQLPDDVEVSRQHCMLVRGTDGACILRDSGSANGTYVNGRLVERHILQVGDLIQVGGARLEFRLGRREDLEGTLSDALLIQIEETTASRADTAAFRKPTQEGR